MKVVRIALLVLGLFLGLSLSVACAADGEAYHCDNGYVTGARALEKSRKTRDAISTMLKGLESCEGYSEWMYLGRLYHKTRNHRESQKVLAKAKQFAKNKNEQAEAVARFGDSLLASGKPTEALPILQAALQLFDTPPQWLAEQTRQLDASLSDQTGQKQLATRGFSSQSFGLLSITPSINVRMSFKSNSVELDDEAIAQLPALANQLANDKYQDNTIWLIGHSDARGEQAYNMKLSWARSEAIMRQLISINSSLESRLDIDGKGEQEPLYKGNNEEDYSLNRRLQIVIE